MDHAWQPPAFARHAVRVAGQGWLDQGGHMLWLAVVVLRLADGMRAKLFGFGAKPIGFGATPFGFGAEPFGFERIPGARRAISRLRQIQQEAK